MALRTIECTITEAAPSPENVTTALSDLDISVEPFLTAFFASPSKGFAKTG